MKKKKKKTAFAAFATRRAVKQTFGCGRKEGLKDPVKSYCDGTMLKKEALPKSTLPASF